ncbi:hypothetical protein RFI_04441, partial [Reticulomyxa filosa]
KIRNARMYLVMPLQNILSREISHAIDMRTKYNREKRHYDDICTTIEQLKKDLSMLDQMKQQESFDTQHQDDQSITANPLQKDDTAHDDSSSAQNETKTINLASRLKMTWARLSTGISSSDDESGFRTGCTRSKDRESYHTVGAMSPENRAEYETQLKEAREKYKACLKSFETSKQQLLECIELIENKLNLETDHYFKQFGDFVEKSHGDQKLFFSFGNPFLNFSNCPTQYLCYVVSSVLSQKNAGSDFKRVTFAYFYVRPFNY